VHEAMASGVPVGASDAAPLPEVVGDAAWLVNPQDTDSIASALEQALQDDAWCRNAVTSGLARTRSLTWANCVDQTVSVYRQLMRRH